MTINWNIGCGHRSLEGWVNIDRRQLPGVNLVQDITLPFGEENTVDEFLLSHIIEHLEDPLGVMENLHRVAKPGAKMTIRCPYGSSDDAFEDPTHIRQYFEHSFAYFSQPMYWRADYGYRGDWQVDKVTLYVKAEHVGSDIYQYIKTRRNVVEEMVCELHAVKPIREARSELQTPLTLEVVVMSK